MRSRAKPAPRYGTVRRPWTPVVTGDVARVPLTGGAWATVDAADLPLVAPYAWRLCNGYASTWTKDGALAMHRLIAAVDERPVDHRDRDRLNNTRANLRQCSMSENARRRSSPLGQSPFKGAAFHKASGLYHATITKDRRQHSLGYFKTAEQAAAAYDRAAVEMFGEFALTNAELGLLPSTTLQQIMERDR